MRLNNSRLQGSQIEQLHGALLDAFSLQRFDEMLRFQTNHIRERIALGDDFQAIVYRVIDRAEMESWTSDLVLGARRSRPENSLLLAFAAAFGLSPAVELARDLSSLTSSPSRVQLEREIRKANRSLDVTTWREELGRAEGRVCRVEVRLDDAIAYGTGLLLGPELVMTNHHVLEEVINGTVPQDRVTLRFDFKVMSNGTKVNDGVPHKLAADWLVDSSPLSPLDLVPEAAADPPEDQLDYALVRVADAPGNEPVGGQRQTGTDAPARGWFTPQPTRYDFVADSALFILQHPAGNVLKLALDTQAVIGANQSGTRVRYRTNTEHGSSGSPCFESSWGLVALHHSGDPDYSKLHHPTYNQGIPFAAILKLLERRGKLDLLGEQAP
jgi:hypothetical protein